MIKGFSENKTHHSISNKLYILNPTALEVTHIKGLGFKISESFEKIIQETRMQKNIKPN